MIKTLSFCLVLIFLSACASNIPVEIQNNPENEISLEAVQRNVDQFKFQHVRWGGTIARVENNENDSWIEVVAKDINSYGKPRDGDYSLGRFLVRIDGFIDPDIYKKDRKITVYGLIENRVVRQIDEYAYTYPLIKAEKHYLWREEVYYPYPYYVYYPYYHPYYFYHPYYYHPYFRHHYGFYPRYHFGFYNHW